MSLTKLFVRLMMLAVCAVAFTACNEKAKAVSPAAPQAAGEKMVIGYVDEDSIMNGYNLAQDINEAMLRHQNRIDAAQTQKGNEISKFAAAMEQKYKNNGYLTEESFNADQAKFQKMQNDAQTYVGKLQQDWQNELARSQAQLMDSVDRFITEYAKQKGYDMILRKSATLFIDPKYDVTDEVVEGLNKRYTKVTKK